MSACEGRPKPPFTGSFHGTCPRHNRGPAADARQRKAWLIGGGIGSPSAATVMIRDGGMAGANITILKATPPLGGSLDGAGNAETGGWLRDQIALLNLSNASDEELGTDCITDWLLPEFFETEFWPKGGRISAIRRRSTAPSPSRPGRP